MSQSRFCAQELRLEAEISAKYRGTARIRLETLDFTWNTSNELGPRELNKENVKRLKEVFEGDRVRRLNAKNHIVAVIDQYDLDNAVQASKITADTLLKHNSDPPKLEFPAGYQLRCLLGYHRIQAARETLYPVDAWWTVDLLLADISPELTTTIVEDYSNEKKPPDGEIYRKIWQYEREGNVSAKKRWKARLSHHGRRCLQQLFDYRDGELKAAFDSLCCIPGLWGGMRITTLHKLIDMKCPEEAIHYLELILKTVHQIFGEDKNALQKVDQATIKEIESKAPGHSRHDAQTLEGPILSGKICSAFSRQERETIWSNLRSIDYLIPSLHTFFEDVKYLNACADCLKQLVKLSHHSTVFTALQHKFPFDEQTNGQYILEVSEMTPITRPGRAANQFNIRYRQLWIRAMRHYPLMPTKPKKKKKDLLAKAGVEADEGVLSDFATLADQLKFKSSQIHDLMLCSPDRAIARNALLKARKPDRYQYNDTSLEENVSKIVRLFMTASPILSKNSSPALVSENPNTTGKRYGFPDKDAQEHDAKYLFITHLHNEGEVQGEYITSFFVRQSVYWAFFGRSVDLGTDNDLDPLHPQFSSRGGLSVDEIELAEQQRLGSEELDEGDAEFEPEDTQQGWNEQAGMEQETTKLGELTASEMKALQDILQQSRRRKGPRRRKQRGQEPEALAKENDMQIVLATPEPTEIENGSMQIVLATSELTEINNPELQKLKASIKTLQQARQLQEASEEAQSQQQEERTRMRLQREKEVKGKTLRDYEGNEKRHTQIDMESIVQNFDAAGREQQQRKRTQVQAIHEEEIFEPEGNSATTGTADSRVQQDLVQFAQSVGSPVRITFKIRENGAWRTDQNLLVDYLNRTKIEKLAVEYMRREQKMRLYDTDLNILNPKACFKAAIANKRGILLVIPGREIDINEELQTSVSQLLSDVDSEAGATSLKDILDEEQI